MQAIDMETKTLPKKISLNLLPFFVYKIFCKNCQVSILAVLIQYRLIKYYNILISPQLYKLDSQVNWYTSMTFIPFSKNLGNSFF